MLNLRFEGYCLGTGNDGMLMFWKKRRRFPCRFFVLVESEKLLRFCTEKFCNMGKRKKVNDFLLHKSAPIAAASAKSSPFSECKGALRINPVDYTSVLMGLILNLLY